MDQSALVMERIEAGARFLAEFDKVYPIRVAYWLRESDNKRVRLCVASDQIDETNYDVAYGEVLRITQKLATPYLDPFDIKLAWRDEPFTRAAKDIHRLYPGPTPTRINSGLLGGLSVEEAYIYPPQQAIAVS